MSKSLSRKVKVVDTAHVLEAMTQYLRGLSVVGKDEEVTKFLRVPEGLEITIEKEKE